MDFAPYQSSPPEHGRPFSPTLDGTTSPRASWDAVRRSASPSQQQQQQQQQTQPGQYKYGYQVARSPPPLQHPQPQRGWSASSVSDGVASPSVPASGGGGGGRNGGGGGARGGGRGGFGVGADYFGGAGGSGARDGMVSEFDTSLGIRLDYEACLAYLALPPLGAIVLLILERNSDFVRFHAWQSSLLFTALFILHLIFSWSSVLSWLIVIGDIILIGFLTLRTYQDANTLDRYEVPFIGPIASRFVDDE